MVQGGLPIMKYGSSSLTFFHAAFLWASSSKSHLVLRSRDDPHSQAELVADLINSGGRVNLCHVNPLDAR